MVPRLGRHVFLPLGIMAETLGVKLWKKNQITISRKGPNYYEIHL